MSVVGFALAGGASRRMGRDKALLPWGDTDLLGHTLARLSRVTADARILCGAELRYLDRGVPLVADATPGLGPLAGMLAALEAASGSAVLLLAVDLPNVPVELLARLVELLPGFDAVVPRSSRGHEPLCAIYGPACLEPVRACVAEGRLAMRAFWREIRLGELGPDELAPFGDPERIFVNVNEPGDYIGPAERVVRWPS